MIEQHRQQARIDFEDVADMAKIDLRAFAGRAIHDYFRRPPLGMHDVSVDAGQSDGVNSAMTESGENVCINLSGEDHLCHFQRVIIRNAANFNNSLFDAELLSEIGQLLSTTVNDANPNADLMK